MLVWVDVYFVLNNYKVVSFGFSNFVFDILIVDDGLLFKWVIVEWV